MIHSLPDMAISGVQKWSSVDDHFLSVYNINASLGLLHSLAFQIKEGLGLMTWQPDVSDVRFVTWNEVGRFHIGAAVPGRLYGIEVNEVVYAGVPLAELTSDAGP